MTTNCLDEPITHVKKIVIAAGTLGDSEEARTIQGLLMDQIIILSKLESKLTWRHESRKFDMPQVTEQEEIDKLNRRLPLWGKKRDQQINAKILACYLEMADSGEMVTTDELRARFTLTGLGSARDFDQNFPQMKIISPRNHGQVFAVDKATGVISIWYGAVEAVAMFRKEAGM